MPRRQQETPEQWRDRQIVAMVNKHVGDILEVAAQRIEQQLDPYDGYDLNTRDQAAAVVRGLKRHPD